MKGRYFANRALVDELVKRHKFIEKARQQMNVWNYGIAKMLLGKVLYESLSVTVIEDDKAE